ncbi:uncharacterized protein LOC107269500 isoform X2 [Cephus cinctus]|nr:uncharacterized protein LOC107269500 isoform X2 [Cephus cinctus]
MLMTSTLLASVDANIHGLQERSHAWDTFQLHVAAWNEQIKSLDSKMDLLSRGQEKVVVLDGKVTQLMGLEYKLEKVASRLEETSQRIHQLETPRDPLMGEFATRGVLSTLKVVERKVDRIQTGLATIGTSLKPKRRRNDTSDESGGKFVIRCNTPPAIEEALRDVRAKVDLMYDRVVSDGDSNELADQPASAETVITESQMLNKLWKRITAPQRKTVRTLESLENLIRGLNVNNGNCQREEMDDSVAHDIQELLSCCRASSQRVTSFTENGEMLLKRVEGVVNQVRNQAVSGQESLESYFREQRSHFDSILKQERFCPRVEGKKTPPTVTPLGSDYNGSGDATDDEGSGDDEDAPEGSGDEEAPDGSGHGEEPSLVNSRKFNIPRRNEDRYAESTTKISTPPIFGPWNLTTTTTTVSPTTISFSFNEGSLTTTPKTPELIYVNEGSCEALINTGRPSGVYTLGSLRDFNPLIRDFYTRNCDLTTSGGGWTVIQRRGGQWLGSENFTRSWDEYSFGFGSLHSEFWFGNEYIHRLTYENDVVLRIELEDWEGVTAWAEYSVFRVDGARDNYRVWVSGYNGNATDAFGSHDGTPFSTVDRDNDSAPPCCPCAPSYGGGWWFYSCFEANLNGDYYIQNGPHDSFRGMIWEHWHGDYSLKSSKMMLRPKSSGEIPLDSSEIYPDP